MRALASIAHDVTVEGRLIAQHCLPPLVDLLRDARLKRSVTFACVLQDSNGDDGVEVPDPSSPSEAVMASLLKYSQRYLFSRNRFLCRLSQSNQFAVPFLACRGHTALLELPLQ